MNDSKKDLNKADSIINHSLSRELRKNGKTTEEFEVMLNSLSLEEVIGLKLELATRRTVIWLSIVAFNTSDIERGHD